MMNIKQRKMKIEPRIKLNYNIKFRVLVFAALWANLKAGSINLQEKNESNFFSIIWNKKKLVQLRVYFYGSFLNFLTAKNVSRQAHKLQRQKKSTNRIFI